MTKSGLEGMDVERWRCPADIFFERYSQHLAFDVRRLSSQAARVSRPMPTTCACGKTLVKLRWSERDPWRLPDGNHEFANGDQLQVGDVLNEPYEYGPHKARVIEISRRADGAVWLRFDNTVGGRWFDPFYVFHRVTDKAQSTLTDAPKAAPSMADAVAAEHFETAPSPPDAAPVSAALNELSDVAQDLRAATKGMLSATTALVRASRRRPDGSYVRDFEEEVRAWEDEKKLRAALGLTLPEIVKLRAELKAQDAPVLADKKAPTENDERMARMGDKLLAAAYSEIPDDDFPPPSPPWDALSRLEKYTKVGMGAEEVPMLAVKPASHWTHSLVWVTGLYPDHLTPGTVYVSQANPKQGIKFVKRIDTPRETLGEGPYDALSDRDYLLLVPEHAGGKLQRKAPLDLFVRNDGAILAVLVERDEPVLCMQWPPPSAPAETLSEPKVEVRTEPKAPETPVALRARKSQQTAPTDPATFLALNAKLKQNSPCMSLRDGKHHVVSVQFASRLNRELLWVTGIPTAYWNRAERFQLLKERLRFEVVSRTVLPFANVNGPYDLLSVEDATSVLENAFLTTELQGGVHEGIFARKADGAVLCVWVWPDHACGSVRDDHKCPPRADTLLKG